MELARTRAETSPENALHSTGPKTEEGKARSSMNAYKHGLDSAKTVLPDEDGEEYQRLRADLLAEFRPNTRYRTERVERLAHLIWKQWRAERIEAGFYTEKGATTGAQMAAAICADPQGMSVISKKMRDFAREIAEIRKEIAGWKAEDEASAKQAIRPPVQAEAKKAFPKMRDERGQLLPAQDTLETVNWKEIVQELYYAVSAGPQSGHPLPETYYGAYAIWRKQHRMVDQDIGDDEAGSQLAAMEVAFAMREAGVLPVPGQVWGAPEDLAQWRELAKKEDPFEKWRELVLRDYGRRGVKFGGPVEEESMKLEA